MPRAFTLIELLVVVAIIVVLLALLTPALDKAVYQAELASCGAKLKAVGTGASTYAMDYKGQYPYRPPLDRAKSMARGPSTLMNFTVGIPGNSYDERLILRGYIDVNGHLRCPLTPPIDLTGEPTGSTEAYANTQVHANYSLWYGWRYMDHRGMRKVGDRFEWSDGPKVARFRVLAADQDVVNDIDTYLQTSHPDKAGLLTTYTSAARETGVGSSKAIYSLWGRAKSIQRGMMDRNIVFDDGDVYRYDDTVVDEPRFVRIPQIATYPDGLLFRTSLPEN